MYVYVQRLACAFGCNSSLLNPSGIAWGFLGIPEEIKGGQSEVYQGGRFTSSQCRREMMKETITYSSVDFGVIILSLG